MKRLAPGTYTVKLYAFIIPKLTNLDCSDMVYELEGDYIYPSIGLGHPGYLNFLSHTLKIDSDHCIFSLTHNARQVWAPEYDKYFNVNRDAKTLVIITKH